MLTVASVDAKWMTWIEVVVDEDKVILHRCKIVEARSPRSPWVLNRLTSTCYSVSRSPPLTSYCDHLPSLTPTEEARDRSLYQFRVSTPHSCLTVQNTLAPLWYYQQNAHGLCTGCSSSFQRPGRFKVGRGAMSWLVRPSRSPISPVQIGLRLPQSHRRRQLFSRQRRLLDH